MWKADILCKTLPMYCQCGVLSAWLYATSDFIKNSKIQITWSEICKRLHKRYLAHKKDHLYKLKTIDCYISMFIPIQHCLLSFLLLFSFLFVQSMILKMCFGSWMWCRVPTLYWRMLVALCALSISTRGASSKLQSDSRFGSSSFHLVSFSVIFLYLHVFLWINPCSVNPLLFLPCVFSYILWMWEPNWYTWPCVHVKVQILLVWIACAVYPMMKEKWRDCPFFFFFCFCFCFFF